MNFLNVEQTFIIKVSRLWNTYFYMLVNLVEPFIISKKIVPFVNID